MYLSLSVIIRIIKCLSLSKCLLLFVAIDFLVTLFLAIVIGHIVGRFVVDRYLVQLSGSQNGSIHYVLTSSRVTLPNKTGAAGFNLKLKEGGVGFLSDMLYARE